MVTKLPVSLIDGLTAGGIDDFSKSKLAAFKTGELFTLADFTDTQLEIDVAAAVPGANVVGVFLGDNGSKVYAVDNGNTQIIQFNLTVPYDISTSTLGGTLSLAGQDGNPLGMFITADGTKLFVPGNTNDRIYEYTLSTPWDITSGSFVQFISTLAQDASPQDVWLTADGTKLFLVGGGTDTIYDYTLSTPNSLTGASYSGDSYSVTAQAAIPSDVYFSNDGLQMFVADNATGTVFEYTLTTAFDISAGVSYSGNSIAVLSSLSGVCFDNCGAVFVISSAGSNDSIRQYETLQETVGFTKTEKDKLAGIAPGATAGGIQYDFTLSETITAGSPVALLANGQIENIFQTSGVLGNNYTIFNGTIGDTIGQNYYDACYSSVDNKFFMITKSTGVNETMLYATPSGGTLSFSSATNLTLAGGANSPNRCVYDPTSGYFVAIKTNGSTTLHVNTFDPSTANPTLVDNATASMTPLGSLAIDIQADATGGIVVAYRDNAGNIRARVITVDGSGTVTAIGAETTLATPASATTGTQGLGLAYHSVAAKWYLTYDNNTFGAGAHDPKIRDFSVSGTTITPGTIVDIPITGAPGSNTSQTTQVAYDEDNDRLVFLTGGVEEADGNFPKTIYGWIIDVDGSGVALPGSQITFYDDASATGNAARWTNGRLVYDKGNNKFFFFGLDTATASNGIIPGSDLFPFSLNGGLTGFVVDPSIRFRNYNIFDATNDVMSKGGEVDGTLLISAPNVNTNVVVRPYEASPVTNVGSYIGFLDVAGNATDVRTVNLDRGGIDSNQTGLTIGTEYYIDSTGALTTTATNNTLVGKSIAADTLQLYR